MAIAQVFTYTPRPGATEQFLAIAKRADRIIRGLGGTTRTHSAVAGRKSECFHLCDRNTELEGARGTQHEAGDRQGLAKADRGSELDGQAHRGSRFIRGVL